MKNTENKKIQDTSNKVTCTFNVKKQKQKQNTWNESTRKRTTNMERGIGNRNKTSK